MGQVDDLIEQIDEELEADQVRKYWNKNKNLIVVTLLLTFTALFAFVGWRDWRDRQDHQASLLYLSAMEAHAGGSAAQSHQIFSTLEKEYPRHGYAKLGRMLHARALVDHGDLPGALALLEATAQEGKVGTLPLGDLALLELAALTGDDPAKARGYLERIAADSPVKANALELEGLMLLKTGEEPAAVARFQEARKKASGGPLAQRLEVRLDRMGASVAAPSAAPALAAAQPESALAAAPAAPP
ncbi:MAG: tetratricopeptide repeat protein, partial [Magnetococcales bacterium]|nr:tetratricopeptide repeat protein [Magnetococcales bacterium]